MQPFTKLTAIAAPLPLGNVDTDMIIPKQFLKTIQRTGLGKCLFNDMRFMPDGSERPEFVLNQTAYRHAQILLAGANFGCGSSREHAPWALLDFGIRCVIAPSFADIFHGNCFKNGILPVVLPQDQIDQLQERAKQGKQITVDLEHQCVTVYPENISFDFVVDPFRRDCLLKGLDDIGLTMQHNTDIDAYEAQQRAAQPWLAHKLR
jgi:3-isopropylmalate/(R)-2-methylmalate dehydratase small subunit